jgi:hypothetical protein
LNKNELFFLQHFFFFFFFIIFFFFLLLRLSSSASARDEGASFAAFMASSRILQELLHLQNDPPASCNAGISISSSSLCSLTGSLARSLLLGVLFSFFLACPRCKPVPLSVDGRMRCLCRAMSLNLCPRLCEAGAFHVRSEADIIAVPTKADERSVLLYSRKWNQPFMANEDSRR